MKLLLAAADLQDGRAAAKFVKSWLPREKLILYVAHVVVPPGALSDLNRTIFSDWQKQVMMKARRLVGRLAKSLSSRTLTTRPVVLQGNIKRTLLEFITDHGIHMTVVAPHTGSRARRFFLGSVSETILHNSPTAVAIARSRRRMAGRTVLLGLDGSASSRKAARWLLESHVPHCRVLLIYIEEPPDTILDRMARLDTELPVLLQRSQAARQRRVRHFLERMRKLLSAQGHRVDLVTGEGFPAENILAFAQRHKVEVIVLGSRGLGKVERYMLGSVSSKVARYAGCSVIIVK
jgi:nucleotide-binding universal stress UspA family protein